MRPTWSNNSVQTLAKEYLIRGFRLRILGVYAPGPGIRLVVNGLTSSSASSLVINKVLFPPKVYPLPRCPNGDFSVYFSGEGEFSPIGALIRLPFFPGLNAGYHLITSPHTALLTRCQLAKSFSSV